MYDVMTVGETTRIATADILHVDGQVNSSATVGKVYVHIYTEYIFIYIQYII